MDPSALALLGKVDALVKMVKYDNWVKATFLGLFTDPAIANTAWKWIDEVNDNWLPFIVGAVNMFIGSGVAFFPGWTLVWLFAHDMELPGIELQADKDSAYIWIYICTFFIGAVQFLLGLVQMVMSKFWFQQLYLWILP